MVAAQSTLYTFTMGVTSPAPVPGQPFTITWTGGESNEAVYIVLNYYAPEPSNQNIIEGGNDILSNAPNNGSWTWNVPLDITAARHSLSIGYNTVMLSDTTGIFTILASETSAVTNPVPATTNTAFQTYNGCGLPPFPDYTYTGYQPPCTTTIDGHVETLYPIVPASDSSSFFNIAPSSTTALSTSSASTEATNAISTAFATDVYAQALQCPTHITPTTTKISSAGTTTIFSLIGCNSASQSSSDSSGGGICHTSGYTTISVSGMSSVCCPNGWATTPLNAGLFCFTEMTTQGVKKRQVGTKTLGEDSTSTLVAISGLVFTSAGVVTKEAEVRTGSSVSVSVSKTGKVTSTGTVTMTGSVASASATKSGGGRLELRIWKMWGMVGVVEVLCMLYN